MRDKAEKKFIHWMTRAAVWPAEKKFLLFASCGQEGPEYGQGETGDRQVEGQQIGVGHDGGGKQGPQGIAHETRGVEKPEGAPPRIACEGADDKGKDRRDHARL